MIAALFWLVLGFIVGLLYAWLMVPNGYGEGQMDEDDGIDR